MLNTLITYLKSTRLMGVLFLAFATAMGIGTFIENKHGTNAARILIYEAWWFEAILMLFVVNFVANIKVYRLSRKSKWPVLTIHLALVVIIVGATITRYTGTEGLMSIREQAVSDEIISDETQLKVIIEALSDSVKERQIIEKSLLLSQYTQRHNDFSIHTDLANKEIQIDYVDFISSASEVFQANNSGHLFLKLVLLVEAERQDFYLKEGEARLLNGRTYSFNKPTENAINFELTGDGLVITAPLDGFVSQMTSDDSYEIYKGTKDEVRLKSFYTIEEQQFVIPELPQRGEVSLESNSGSMNEVLDDALILNVKIDSVQKEIIVFGSEKKIGKLESVIINGMQLTVSYGSEMLKLPFKLGLKDFRAEKYPGTTNSYSAFESEIVVIDDQSSFDYDIFMNHVLDYKGYRFFQASFHPDEKGTILSVNHDFYGTWVTYIGYFVLYLGLLLILFDKRSHFSKVAGKLKKLNSSLCLTVVLLVVSGLKARAQEQSLSTMLVREKIDSLVLSKPVPEKQALAFGHLLVQDWNGRMKPMNTYSSEILRKVSKSNTYQGLNSDQVLISILERPQLWYNVPLIYLKRGNSTLRTKLGLASDATHISLAEFFERNGDYKIQNEVDNAYKSIVPNQFDKDYMEVDKRVNLMYNALLGSQLRIFPVPGEKNNKWISSNELSGFSVSKNDSLFIQHSIPLYISGMLEAERSNDYAEADLILEKIKKFQAKYGGDVLPTPSKVNAEVLYNKYDVFRKLYAWYTYVGGLLLILSIVFMLTRGRKLEWPLKAVRFLVYACFILHSVGLIVRAYISGHAPWSDAYETIIYISWATMLFGIILGRKSDLALSATTFVSAIILMVAHWNWLDPAIANLQPVLNSYWLMIHVAIIVASYGPFTLGMVLGLLSLILMIFLKQSNSKDLIVNIKKLVLTTELSLTVGLVMLTIGNFLGGQWANESWGRYWAWDPKETWALISIMLYAFIIHMRLIPKLSSEWLFSLVSVIAFYSILMTYFGVNFYLSGLHSYAKGDNIVTPDFVYYSLLFIGVVSFAAYLKYKKYWFKLGLS
tara:strand:+ start:2644 stop:5799 length:3156 start_codon:yes stop_codon:yes gene_type:complete